MHRILKALAYLQFLSKIVTRQGVTGAILSEDIMIHVENTYNSDIPVGFYEVVDQNSAALTVMNNFGSHALWV